MWLWLSRINNTQGNKNLYPIGGPACDASWLLITIQRERSERD